MNELELPQLFNAGRLARRNASWETPGVSVGRIMVLERSRTAQSPYFVVLRVYVYECCMVHFPCGVPGRAFVCL